MTRAIAQSQRGWRPDDFVFGRNAPSGNVERASVDQSLFDIIAGTDLAMGGVHVAHPFETSIYVYSAICNIALSIAGLPVRMFTADDEPVESHDLLTLMQQPNPEQTGEEFVEALITHYEIDGLAYLVEPGFERVSRTRGRQIFVASKSEMRAIETNGVLVGYHYTPCDGAKAHTLTVEQAQPIRHYHPRRRLEGLAPARVARLAIEGHYGAMNLFRNAVKNGAELGAVFSTDKDLSPTQHDEALKIINTRYSGPANANKPLLLSGGVKVDRGSAGMQDIGWLEGMGVSATMIAMAYRVPPLFVNLMDQAQYNSAPVQERMFWTMNGIPLKRRIENLLNRFVLRSERASFYFSLDTSDIQVLKDQEAEFMESTFALTKHGLARNEINRRFDLGFEDPPYGEVPLVGAGQIPVDVLVDEARAAMGSDNAPEGTDVDPEEETPDTPKPKPEQGKSQRDVVALVRSLRADLAEHERSATTAAIHAKWFKSWAMLRRSTQARLSRFFKRQQVELKRRLQHVELPYADGTKAYKVRAEFDDVLDVILFDLQEENDRLTLTMKTPISDGLELGGKQVAHELASDFAFDLENPAIDQHLKAQVIRVRDINVTTQTRLRNVLRKGLQGGESLSELAERIDRVMNWTASDRSFTIAKTELHEAINAGRAQSIEQSGVAGQRWLTSGRPVQTKGNPGGVVRYAHKHAEVSSRDGIPTGTQFTLIDEEGNREEASYPGDAKLSAGNRINCACVVLAKSLSKSDAVLERVGEYTDERMFAERRKGGSDRG